MGKNTKDIIEQLRNKNPYPEDIFRPKTKEEWNNFHFALRKRGLGSDGYAGEISRRVWNNCCDELEKMLDEEPEQVENRELLGDYIDQIEREYYTKKIMKNREGK